MICMVSWAESLRAKTWGVGITIGDINGFSLKKTLSNNRNGDLNLGWYTYEDELNLVISAHYNWVSRGYIKLDQTLLDAYIGLGIKLPGHGEHAELRTPFGVSYGLSSNHKFEVFGALIPGMTLYPSTAMRLSLALGGYFYF